MVGTKEGPQNHPNKTTDSTKIVQNSVQKSTESAKRYNRILYNGPTEFCGTHIFAPSDVIDTVGLDELESTVGLTVGTEPRVGSIKIRSVAVTVQPVSISSEDSSSS